MPSSRRHPALIANSKMSRWLLPDFTKLSPGSSTIVLTIPMRGWSMTARRRCSIKWMANSRKTPSSSSCSEPRLEARSYESGSLPRAKSILAQQEALIAKLAHPRPDLPVWLSSARGMVALIENNAKSAAENFQIAVDHAAVLPDSIRLPA